MFKLSGRCALICAVLPIGLLAAGCSSFGGMGSEGYHEVVAGNWPAAKADFEQDYRSAPNHPIAQFNMGTAYHHSGEVNTADRMFSEAVMSDAQLNTLPKSPGQPIFSQDEIGRASCRERV